MSNIDNMVDDLLDDEDIAGIIDEYDLNVYTGEPIALTSMRMPVNDSRLCVDTVNYDDSLNIRGARDFSDKLQTAKSYVVVNDGGVHLEIFMRIPNGGFVSIAYGDI